jgi:hypothetical protein
MGHGSASWITMLVGALVAAVILWMVRRNKLLAGRSLWWLMVALGSVILGFFPRLMDWAALRVGVYYPPIFVAMIVIAMLLIKILVMDLDLSEKERKIRALAQKIAILEHEIGQGRKAKESFDNRT